MKPPAAVGPTHLQRGARPSAPPPHRGCHLRPSPGLLTWQLLLALHGAHAPNPERGRGQAEPLLLAPEWRKDRVGPGPPGLPSEPRGAPAPQHETASPCSLLATPTSPTLSPGALRPQAGQRPWQVPGVACDPSHVSCTCSLTRSARSPEEVPVSLRCRGARGGGGPLTCCAAAEPDNPGLAAPPAPCVAHRKQEACPPPAGRLAAARARASSSPVTASAHWASGSGRQGQGRTEPSEGPRPPGLAAARRPGRHSTLRTHSFGIKGLGALP